MWEPQLGALTPTPTPKTGGQIASGVAQCAMAKTWPRGIWNFGWQLVSAGPMLMLYSIVNTHAHKQINITYGAVNIHMTMRSIMPVPASRCARVPATSAPLFQDRPTAHVGSEEAN